MCVRECTHARLHEIANVCVQACVTRSLRVITICEVYCADVHIIQVLSMAIAITELFIGLHLINKYKCQTDVQNV